MRKHAWIFVGALVCCAMLFTQCTLESDKDKNNNPVGPGTPTATGQTHNGFATFHTPDTFYTSVVRNDSLLTLSWTLGDTASFVTIELFCNDTLLDTIGATNNNTFTWNLSLSSPSSGSKYQIKVTNLLDSTKWDKSSYFTIRSQYFGTISVSAPTAATNVSISSSLTIRWTATDSVGGRVSIYLFKGTDSVSRISSSVYYYNNTGSYTWTVATSQGSGSNYQIVIRSYYDQGIEGKSAPFTITSQYSGGYLVTQPSKGDTLTAGSADSVRWTTIGSPGSYVNIDFCAVGDTTEISVLSATPNDGRQSFTVPGNLASGRYRIRVESYYDAGIFAYSDTIRVEGLDPDSFENDDSRATANAIPLTGVVQRHTLTLNDTDWISFSGQRGVTYFIRNEGDFRTRVYIYQGSNSAYETNWYAGDYDTSPYLYWPCDSTDTYYVRIAPYTTGENGNYTFSILPVDSMKLITFTEPTSSSVWAAGSAYDVQWTSDSLIGTYIYLYLYRDTTYVTSVYTSYTPNDGLYSWSIPAGLATGSNYRIQGRDYTNSNLYGFSEEFTISGVAEDEYEPDDDRNSATPLPISDSLQQHSNSIGDTDWVSFQGVAGTTYLIRNPGDFRTRLYLYQGTNASYTTYIYAGNYDATPYLIWTCSSTDDYYIRVTPYSSSYYGDYSIGVATFDSLNLVTFTEPNASSVWASGTSYNIQWTTDSVLFSTYVYLYLYRDTSYVTMVYGSYTANDGAYTWTVPAGLVTGSDYRIKLVDYSNSNIYSFSDAFTISGISEDAYEPDGQRTDATPLSISDSLQQHSITVGDTDWVSFQGVAGTTYLIRNPGDLTTRVYLYQGTSTSYLTYLYAGDYDATPYLQWTCSSTATYYLRVTPYTSSDYGDYSIGVIMFDSLNLATFTSPVSSTVWSAGSAATIQWSTDSIFFSSSYVNLYLYRDSTLLYTIASTTANDGTQSFTLPAGLASGSNYRIRVQDYSNSSAFGYSDYFTISGVLPDSLEPDDSRAAAHATLVDGSVYQHSITYRDTDWVSFQGVKDSLYLIRGASTPYLYVYLYQGQQASYTAYHYGYAPQIAFACTSSGTYYLRINSNSVSSTGNYTFSVREYSTQNLSSFINPTSLSTWSAGVAQNIQWAPDTGLFSANVRLYFYRDSTLLQTITSSTSNLAGQYAWTVPAGMMTGSNYRIQMRNYSNSQIYGFSEFFTVSGQPADAYEPDDSLGQAHGITAGSTENHTLALYDVDWYSFSAQANHVYQIEASGLPYMRTTLFNPAGTQVLGGDTSSSIADSVNLYSWYCATAGTYYFRNAGYSVYYGNYQALLTELDSSAFRFSVTAPAAGDSLTLGTATSVQWTDNANLGGYVDIFLYNSGGVVSTIVSNTPNDGAQAWSISAATPAGNDYYVRVISRINSNIYGNSGVFVLRP